MIEEYAIDQHIAHGVSLNWAQPHFSRRTGNSKEDLPDAKSPLVAIILATKSSRGESVVFHYPAEPEYANLEQNSLVDDFDSCSETDEIMGNNTRQPPPTTGRGSDSPLPTINERESSQEVREVEWKPPWHTILGLDSSVLADIFTPQKTDEKFELWVDDLVFLGMPIHLNNTESWAGQDERRRDGKVNKKESIYQKNMQAVCARLEHYEVSGLEIALKEMDPTTSGDPPCPMTTFHLVFALHTDIDRGYRKRIDELYKHIVVPLTLSLLHEQFRSDHLWTQSEEIRSLKRKGETNRVNITSLWADIIKQSDLAALMQQVYEAVSNDELAHITINKRLDLSLAIPRRVTTDALPRRRDIDHPFLNSALSFGTALEMADPLLIPHYGLLLLAEPEMIIAQLPRSADGKLDAFVRAILPTRTLYSLANKMQSSVQETLVLAQYLLKWRCVLLIPPLHPDNTYMTSPTADVKMLPRHTQYFARRFPDLPPLPAFLAEISKKAVPFSTFIPQEGSKVKYLNALAWMMREKWVMQMRTFVWVKIRAEFKAAVARDEMVKNEDDPWHPNTNAIVHDEMFQDSILADPYSATDLEKSWLEKLAAHHPVADASLFKRINKYFNGKHAVEKIIVREGVDPRALRRLLESFDEDLVKSYTW